MGNVPIALGHCDFFFGGGGRVRIVQASAAVHCSEAVRPKRMSRQTFTVTLVI